MPLIGGPDDLALVHNLDQNTWTIPSIIQYGLGVLVLVNWHNLSNTNEGNWSLMSDKSEEDSEDLNVHSMLPPLEYVGSSIEPESPPPSELLSSNLAPSTSYGPTPCTTPLSQCTIISTVTTIATTHSTCQWIYFPICSYGRGRGRGSL